VPLQDLPDARRLCGRCCAWADGKTQSKNAQRTTPNPGVIHRANGARIPQPTLQVWKSDGPKSTLNVDQITRISLPPGIYEGLQRFFRRAPQESERSHMLQPNVGVVKSADVERIPTYRIIASEYAGENPFDRFSTAKEAKEGRGPVLSWRHSLARLRGWRRRAGNRESTDRGKSVRHAGRRTRRPTGTARPVRSRAVEHWSGVRRYREKVRRMGSCVHSQTPGREDHGGSACDGERRESCCTLSPARQG